MISLKKRRICNSRGHGIYTDFITANKSCSAIFLELHSFTWVCQCFAWAKWMIRFSKKPFDFVFSSLKSIWPSLHSKEMNSTSHVGNSNHEKKLPHVLPACGSCWFSHHPRRWFVYDGLIKKTRVGKCTCQWCRTQDWLSCPPLSHGNWCCRKCKVWCWPETNRL